MRGSTRSSRRGRRRLAEAVNTCGGIAGIWDPDGRIGVQPLQLCAKAMGDSLAARGPDDAGTWTDDAARLAFSHRRLSIIDLSPAGHQPMLSRCQRYVIAYNGEVYNFVELAEELRQQGVEFRGHSDTEVILEACARWGLEATVERLIGMFAFALWDRETRTLRLARDRLGIKPLYWGRFGSLFLFGSELKALRECPGWDVELDRDSLAAYLRFKLCSGAEEHLPRRQQTGARMYPDAAGTVTIRISRVTGAFARWPRGDSPTLFPAMIRASSVPSRI